VIGLLFLPEAGEDEAGRPAPLAPLTHPEPPALASQPLEEGRDYYIEGGLYVFTSVYLRQRGYCCRNGCRHCPYGFRKPAAGTAPSGPPAPEGPAEPRSV
jgi:Family of unknown function (DUF5522)